MVAISKWSLSTSALFLIVSALVLVGWSSAAPKNRTCYQCFRRNPDCDEEVTCKPEERYCTQIVVNGHLIFKGCTETKKSVYKDIFPYGTCRIMPYAEWKEKTKAFGRSSATLNDVLEFKEKMDTLADDDYLKMCMCDSDYCNTKEQLRRIYYGSGTVPPVSGLVFGNSFAVLFLARLIFGS